MAASPRYFELDWLRVILILAVFLHHCLMPFNGDDWHIMNTQSSRLLDDAMVYFEQFRLPSLFFVAGAGAFILLNKRSPTAFIKDKVTRLLLPLVIGVIFVVPPQTYIENINDHASYLKAYPEILLNFDTNHLWFIEFLFVFMLVAIPLHRLITHGSSHRVLAKISNALINPYILLVLGGGIGTIRVLLKCVYPENSHSILNLSTTLFYLAFFALGMLFLSNLSCWQSLKLNRRTNLCLLAATSILFYMYYFIDFSPYFSLQTRWSIWWFLCTLVSWLGLVTVVGYAQQYLSHGAKYLSLSNELIYPFYIFHQSVIVILGYQIIAMDMPILGKALLLIATSFILTGLICRYCIAPFNLFRRMFGLKQKKVEAE